jgi:hypothetical protein
MAVFPSRDWEPFVAHWRTKALGNATARTKAVLVSGTIAGYVASFDGDGRRLVAYWIGREFWGNGVASAALAEFVNATYERRSTRGPRWAVRVPPQRDRVGGPADTCSRELPPRFSDIRHVVANAIRYGVRSPRS